MVQRVRFGDLDALQHMNNVEFLRFFETARIDYIRQLLPGHTPGDREQFGFIFAECHIDYRAPAFFGDDIRTTSGSARCGARRCASTSRWSSRRDDRKVAEGYGWLVGYDYDAGKPQPLPDELRERHRAGAAGPGRIASSAAWPRRSTTCIVIGSGPGGYVAAIRAAQLGMKTAVVEKDKVGGRCLNYACIPAKAVLRAADVLTEVERRGGLRHQRRGPRRSTWRASSKHRDKVVKTLTGGVAGLFKKNKIDLIEGHGSVTDDGNVKIGGQFDGTEIEAGKVIIATGLGAQADPGPPVRRPRARHGDRVGAATSCPSGSPSSAPARPAPRSRPRSAGSAPRSSLLEALPQILPLEDKDIARTAAREIAKQNVKIVTDANIESVEAERRRREDHLRRRDRVVRLHLHRRRAAAPTPRALGLEEAGVKTDDRGLIVVDGALRTSLENVYAIGDIVPGPALAHKASDEGVIAAEDAAGDGDAPDRLPVRPGRHLLLPAGRELRHDRGRGQGRRATTSSSARCRWAPSARRPSTATAAA